MGNHQKAFVKVKVVLIASQLTLPRVQDAVEQDAGGAAVEFHCLRLEFLCAFIRRFRSTITSRTAGVRSQWVKGSLQSPWAIQTSDDSRGHIPWLSVGS